MAAPGTVAGVGSSHSCFFTQGQCGKFNPAVRVILGIEDICEFDTTVEDNKLIVKDIECLSYPVLKHIEQEGFNIHFHIKKASMTISRAKLI